MSVHTRHCSRHWEEGGEQQSKTSCLPGAAFLVRKPWRYSRPDATPIPRGIPSILLINKDRQRRLEARRDDTNIWLQTRNLSPSLERIGAARPVASPRVREAGAGARLSRLSRACEINSLCSEAYLLRRGCPARRPRQARHSTLHRPHSCYHDGWWWHVKLFRLCVFLELVTAILHFQIAQECAR